MKDQIKLPLTENVKLILRVGKNGLSSYLQSDIIAKMLVDVALSTYIEQQDGNIFNEVVKKKKKIKKNTTEIKNHIKTLRMEKNILLIDH